MIGLRIVDLSSLGPEHCYFPLPMTYYSTPPVIGVQNLPSVDREHAEEPMPGEETPLQTFERLGLDPRRVEIGAEEVLVGGRRNSLYIPESGWHSPDWSQDVIIPDRLKWGEIIEWCERYGDLAQSTFYPVGVALEEQIVKFLARHGR